MTLDDVRGKMDSVWASANREADDLRDPFLAMERVSCTYHTLGAAERQWAGQVIAEWVLSDDEAKRFDAVALVRELCVAEATPALRALIGRLDSSGDPGAPFEREKVEDVMSELGSGGYYS